MKKPNDDNPWLKESEKHNRPRFDDIRDLKFADNKTYNIRVLPNPVETKPPFYGYIIHWIPQVNSKKGRPIVHHIDKRCCVCHYIADLWKEINRLKEEDDLTEKSPEVVKVAKLIEGVRGQRKYDMNVLHRGDTKVESEDGKTSKIVPKRMCAPQTVWSEILKFAEKWGSPSNIKNGYDLEITTEGEQARREYSVIAERDESPLSEEEIEAIKRGYDVEKLRKTTTQEEIAEILENSKDPYSSITQDIDDDDGDKKKKEDDDDDEEKTEEDTEKEKPAKKKDDDEEEEEEAKKDDDEEEEKPKKKEEKKDDDDDEEEEEEETPKIKEEKKDEEDDDEDEEEPKKKEEKKDDDEDSMDAKDLNSYECKGQFSSEDRGCSDEDDPCPVKDDCVKFSKYYEKAKKLGIEGLKDKKTADIIKEIEKLETKDEEEEEEKPKRRLRKEDDEEKAEKKEEEEKPKKRKLPF